MALFNNDIETDIPRHTYTMVSTVDNTPKVIKRDSDKATIHERNKTIEIEAPALIQVPEVIEPIKTSPEIITINNSNNGNIINHMTNINNTNMNHINSIILITCITLISLLPLNT
jgi:hypothetical protein